MKMSQEVLIPQEISMPEPQKALSEAPIPTIHVNQDAAALHNLLLTIKDECVKLIDSSKNISEEITCEKEVGELKEVKEAGSVGWEKWGENSVNIMIDIISKIDSGIFCNKIG
jgi:hypothetical protein